MRLFDLPHLVALTLTLTVETGGMALLAAASRQGPAFVRRCAAIALAVNLVSHTAFWIGFPRLAGPGFGLYAAETLVTLVEALAYGRWCPMAWWRALAVSALLNLASLVLGSEVWRLI